MKNFFYNPKFRLTKASIKSSSMVLFFCGLLLIQPLAQADTTQITPKENSSNFYPLLEAEFAYNRGEITKALQIYKKEAIAQKSSDIFERALSLSLLHEDEQASLDFAYQWQKQHPDYKPVWFYVAHLALQTHDYALAKKNLNYILKYNPQANFEQVLENIYPSKEDDQKRLLVTLQQLNNDKNADLSILKAGLLLKFDYPKNALTEVNNALRIEPYNPSYLLLKADILKKMGKSKQLLRLLARARKKIPDEKNFYIYEIRYRLALQKAGSHGKQIKYAWRLALKMCKQFPDDPEVIFLTALIGLDLQEYDKVNQLLMPLIDNPEYRNQAYYYLGLSFEKQQDYQQAKEYYAQIQQEDLAYDASKRIVVFELKNNNSSNAIKALENLRNNFADYAPESYLLQADILKRQKQYSQAKNLLKKAHHNYPNDTKIQFAYAKLLNNKSDYRIKLNLLSQLKKNYPENLDYQLHYGLLLLAKSSSNKQAQHILQQIVDIEPTDSRFNSKRYLVSLNTLATIALAKKDYQRVINNLQLAYQKYPNLTSGLLLLESYRGINNQAKLQALKQDLQERFDYVETEN